jgi:ATP-dependent DNA ligase
LSRRPRQIRTTRFILDGEAVVLGVDGISDFNALHSRKGDHEVQLYAFVCLALGGDDISGMPLFLRKTNLAQLLRGRSEGIFAAPFEQGEISPQLFEAACRMGLEVWSQSTVSAPTAAECDHWVKVKNRKHPAFSRVAERF